MFKELFDLGNNDILTTTSDNMAMNLHGDLFQRVDSHTVMNLKSGELRTISSEWEIENHDSDLRPNFDWEDDSDDSDFDRDFDSDGDMFDF